MNKSDNNKLIRLNEEVLKTIDSQIPDLNRTAIGQANERWLNLCKPLYSLGRLEQAITRLSGISGQVPPCLNRCATYVFCADNGVVSEGVSQTGAEVTATVARNIAEGRATVNCFADSIGAEVYVINVGIKDFFGCKGVRQRPIGNGSANLCEGPAMTREQTVAALQIGVDCAAEASREGFDVVVGGEMGIGNTTPATAILSVLLNLEPEIITARGAGLDNSGLKRKISAVRRGIAINKSNTKEPFTLLMALGGFDIAALTGLYIGSALYQLPILLDGLISYAAAAIAISIAPNVKKYMIATHLPQHMKKEKAMESMAKQALLDLDLANGEGAGALLALPLLRMTLEAFVKLPTFLEGNVEPYRPFN